MVSLPKPPSLTRRIDRLEQRLRALEKRRTLGRASLGGDTGGQIQIADSAGNVIAILGTTVTGQTGLFIIRPDGSPAFYAWTSAGGFAAMFDHAGNYVVTEDTTSGQGLARPYVPLGMFTDNTTPTRTTTSSTFVTLQTLIGYKQHPKVTMQIIGNAGMGSPGEIRVVDQNGTQVGDTQVFAAGQFEYRTIRGVLAGDHMTAISLNIQARITAGMVGIGVRGGTAWGVESGAF